MSKVIEIKMVDHLDRGQETRIINKCIHHKTRNLQRYRKAKSHLERARGMYLALKILDLMSRYAELSMTLTAGQAETLQRKDG